MARAEREGAADMLEAKRRPEASVHGETGRLQFKFAKPKVKPVQRKLWKASDLTAMTADSVRATPPPQCVVDKLIPCDLMDVFAHYCGSPGQFSRLRCRDHWRPNEVR